VKRRQRSLTDAPARARVGPISANHAIRKRNVVPVGGLGEATNRRARAYRWQMPNAIKKIAIRDQPRR
jgi:hypothetical protein